MCAADRLLVRMRLILLGALASGCGGEPQSVGEAGPLDASLGDTYVPPEDGFVPADDVALVNEYICSGEPVPLDLECVTQNLRTTSPCGDRGHYVFDGSVCNLSQGVECTGELGAFDTLEDCAVTCARAGHCTVVWVDGIERSPHTCDDVREHVTCETISVQGGADIPDDCALWAPFGRHARGGPRVPGDGPEAMLMLFSASLAPPYGAFCAVVP